MGVVGHTHIRAADLGAALLEAALDVLPLISLVVPQPSDEVVERLFEPVFPASVESGREENTLPPGVRTLRRGRHPTRGFTGGGLLLGGVVSSSR